MFSTMEKLCQLWKKCKKEVKKSAIEIEITTLEKASARRIDRNCGSFRRITAGSKMEAIDK